MTAQATLDLTLPADVRFSARAVYLPPGLTAEQWLEVGRYLSKARGSLAFWIADWHAYGRRTLGDEKVREGIAQLHFEFEDMRAVEKLNTVAERVEGLSAEHHFVLGKTKSPDDQKMWAETAVREELTPRELQISIRAGQVQRIEPDRTASGGQSGGVSTVHGVRMQWDLLRKQIGDQWETWTPETRDAFMDELRPIIDFWDQLVAKMDAEEEPAPGGAAR